MKYQKIPDYETRTSIQSIISIFEKFFSTKLEPDNLITQNDGSAEIPQEVKTVPSCLYGVSCEIKEITTWINFSRGFNIIWEGANDHLLCPFDCSPCKVS